ncbi:MULTISPECIES: hypothetical protein [unclassified Caulobacter]|uniref:hypothetical protein n=1 Tax=unclassified Caulobacter TaxID=2648921 RepID=UPI0018EEAF16|nr:MULTISPECIES: hypothetical protein [unclassified Caulobacter]
MAAKGTTLVVERTPDETDDFALARVLLTPQARHAFTSSAYAAGFLGNESLRPELADFARAMKAEGDKAAAGDLELASRLLASQAMTLDGMFTELARRAAINMGAHLGASEKYARLALKAQSNCRATLEALARLHQPREQTVRHVHVNEGGQAVIADEFHHHSGGRVK